MRLLVVQPGASYATADVHTGLVRAFRAQGHEIVDYDLDKRIYESGAWLRYLWKRNKRKGFSLGQPQPTPADVQYHAGQGVITRALRFQVDWVIVVSAMYFHPDLPWLLRQAGKRVALVFTESPYDDARQIEVAPMADICFTNERLSVDVLRQTNPNTYYLPHAYDPTIHRPLLPEDEDADRDVPRHDVLFVGSAFQERIEFLEAIDWTGIDLGLYGEWSLLKKSSPLRQYMRGDGPIENSYAVRLYRRAKINLNIYRTSVGFGEKAPKITGAESLNPRAYELAACEAFQLSSVREEVLERFGASVPMFERPADAESLIRLFLGERPEVAAEYAAESLRRIGCETWAERAKTVMNLLDSKAAYAEAAG